MIYFYWTISSPNRCADGPTEFHEPERRRGCRGRTIKIPRFRILSLSLIICAIFRFISLWISAQFLDGISRSGIENRHFSEFIDLAVFVYWDLSVLPSSRAENLRGINDMDMKDARPKISRDFESFLSFWLSARQFGGMFRSRGGNPKSINLFPEIYVIIRRSI